MVVAVDVALWPFSIALLVLGSRKVLLVLVLVLLLVIVKLTVTGRAMHASNKQHHDTNKETGTMIGLTSVIINEVVETILPPLSSAS